jgi:hypothetical protein
MAWRRRLDRDRWSAEWSSLDPRLSSLSLRTSLAWASPDRRLLLRLLLWPLWLWPLWLWPWL